MAVTYPNVKVSPSKTISKYYSLPIARHAQYNSVIAIHVAGSAGAASGHLLVNVILIRDDVTFNCKLRMQHIIEKTINFLPKTVHQHLARRSRDNCM